MNKEKIKHVNGIIDCHTHAGAIDINNYYHCRFPAMNSVKNLKDVMIENGVDYAITFPMPSTIYYDVKEYWDKRIFSASGMCDFPFQMENEYLLAEVSYFDEQKILPFLSFGLNSDLKEQYNYIMGACDRNHVYGLKFHSKADQNSIGDLMNIGELFIRILLDKNIPLICHCENTGVSSPMNVFKLLEKYPKLRVSLAHYAGMSKAFFKEYDEYIKSYDNLYFDTAPSICMCRRYGEMYKINPENMLSIDYSNPVAMNAYFVEKYNNNVMWGTDYPWLFSDDLNNKSEEMITYIDEMELRKSVEKITCCYDNKVVNRFLFSE